MSEKNEQQIIRDSIERLIREVNSKSILEDYNKTGNIDLIEYISCNSQSLLKYSKLLSTMSITIESQQRLINSMLHKLQTQEKQIKLLNNTVIGIAVTLFVLTILVFVN